MHGKLWRSIRATLTAKLQRHSALHPVRTHPRQSRAKNDAHENAAPPRILILTSGLGSGHVRAATALQLALLRQTPGAVVQLLDWWSLINAGVAQAIQSIYLRLVQEHSLLYERIYRLDEHTWRGVLSRREPLPASVVQLLELIAALHVDPTGVQAARGPYGSDRALFNLLCTAGAEGRLVAGGIHARLALLKWSWSRLAHRLERRLLEFAPDVVVSTQMIPAALVSFLKAGHRLNMPSVAVPTDFGVHDFWNQPGTDLFCLGHEAISELPPGLDSWRLAATGFPLMPRFAQPMDTHAARRALGLQLDVPAVLILGGGLGLGVDSVAQRLLATPMPLQLLVLTGRNAQALTKLRILADQYPGKLKIYEWTERADMFIRAADLVVGKPGGLSMAEVLACGRPLLATRSLRGQEGFNVRFLERHRAGWLLADEQLIPRIQFLLTHRADLAALQARAWRLGRRDGAAQIAMRVVALATRERRATEFGIWRT